MLRSCAIGRYFKFPAPDAPDDAFHRELVAAIRATGYDTIIPAGDTPLEAVAQDEVRLRPIVHLGCPSADAVEQVLDKDRPLAAALRRGVPVPVQYSIRDAAELDRIAGSLRFPLVVKPVSKRHASPFKFLTFRSLAELHATFRADPEFGECNLFQEYCPGVGVGVEILLHRGQPVALFQHRRLKENLIAGGVSVLAEPVLPDAGLTELALRLLREIGWEGVAMVELRHDPATGRAALMEVNGRYWGSLRSRGSRGSTSRIMSGNCRMARRRGCRPRTRSACGCVGRVGRCNGSKACCGGTSRRAPLGRAWFGSWPASSAIFGPALATRCGRSATRSPAAPRSPGRSGSLPGRMPRPLR